MPNEMMPTTPRLRLIAPAAATDPTVLAVYAEIERELGFGIVPNVFRALGDQPATLRAVWELFRATMLQGKLPRIVKEMIGVVVSATHQSGYALSLHLHSLTIQGVGANVLAALAAGGEVPGIAPGVAALLRLSRRVAGEGPLAVDDTDLATLTAEGVTAEELAEVIATINLFRYLNGLTDLARVPVDAL